MRRFVAGAGFVLVGLSPLAAAEPVLTTAATVVRVGDHPGYSRVVFDLPPRATVNVVTEGQRVLLVFQGAGGVVQPADLPRNLGAIRTGLDTATLDLVPGAKARPARIGDRLIVDVLDPQGVRAPVRAGTPPKPVASRPEAAKVPPATVPSRVTGPDEGSEERGGAPVQVPAGAPGSPSAATEPVFSDSLPAPAAVPASAASAPGPAAPPSAVPPPAAPVIAMPPPAAGVPIIIKADGDTGAAAFRRGSFGVVVLDRRLPEQEVPTGVSWGMGVASTMVQIPLPPDKALRMTRTGTGWSIVPVPLAELEGVAMSGQEFAVARPGRRVAVLDPVSQGTLLVGASLDTGAGLALGRRMPGYRLLPSWLGVAVEPISDQVDLRVASTGFVLVGDALSSIPTGTAISRRFDLPALSRGELSNRLRAQLASAATAPPRTRSRDRIGAVQTMIALGMGAEAQALAQQVAGDDPQEAADAQTGALAAVAAILAGRPGEAGSLNDPRLDGNDEIQLWRGLRDRQLRNESEAARRLGSAAVLVQSYPKSLQRLVWPEIAEAAIESGSAIPADKLPPYVQALQLERTGKLDDAIAAFDRVAAGSDRLDQVRATARAAELRLAANRITPAEAAAVMERQSFAWRGDAREAGFRLRAAELKAAAREWRPALDALRAIEASFPEQKAAVQVRKSGVMQALLTAEGAGLSALDLVLLTADYADCIPEGPAGTALSRLLAEKLAALDLPARAIPVLQGLMRTSQAGEPRAEFGLRLGQLLFEGGDAVAAVASLDASDAPGLSAALQERRTLLAARLEAAKGNLPGAAAALRQLGTEQADDLRATLLGNAGDWRGSLAALAALSARVVPASGKLDDGAQAVLVRQANAAAQAGDAMALQSLRREAARLDGPRADVFRLLTAAPLDTAADLARAKRELTAARDLPQRLQAAGLR